MSHDISQPVPQGGNGAQDAENSRIAAIADMSSSDFAQYMKRNFEIAKQM